VRANAIDAIGICSNRRKPIRHTQLIGGQPKGK
jgi:hypothetical protein